MACTNKADVSALSGDANRSLPNSSHNRSIMSDARDRPIQTILTANQFYCTPGGPRSATVRIISLERLLLNVITESKHHNHCEPVTIPTVNKPASHAFGRVTHLSPKSKSLQDNYSATTLLITFKLTRMRRQIPVPTNWLLCGWYIDVRSKIRKILPDNIWSLQINSQLRILYFAMDYEVKQMNVKCKTVKKLAG